MILADEIRAFALKQYVEPVGEPRSFRMTTEFSYCKGRDRSTA
jgi:hypothetical protein